MRTLSSLFILFILVSLATAQQSGRNYRRASVMSGNLVKTVFGNWGVIGQPAERGSRGAWIYENNGYIGDVSLLVGAEVDHEDQRFHSVVVCPVDRPTAQHELSPSGSYWTFEPVNGYFGEEGSGIALYSNPRSWPDRWPDKLNDPDDPGWGGSWNGYFGKTTTASEEAFFVMDDNNDEEFNFADNNKWGVAFKPDSTDLSRNGLGLEVKVRAMQWSDFLAQDCIFWLYEITNTSTTDYNKVSFGMLVGTYVGVTSEEDYREYDDDYSFFDVERDLTYTGDYDDDASRNPLWTGEVGVVGYAFLESPGNPFDGIDNDRDSGEPLNVVRTAPLFVEEDFEPRLINAGDRIVLINSRYEREVVTMPSETSTFVSLGDTITIEPGVTELVEGNVILIDGQEEINPNVYDGLDNDLDGLIDENYYLHYRQLRRDQDGNVLIDRVAPTVYKDYVNNIGLDDPMVDERRNDGIDNDNDWNPEFDDVGADGIAGTKDTGEADGMPTAGEPNFDQTDVDESDQIGLTSFEYFTPANAFNMADDEDLWNRMSPGFFKVPESIVNNRPVRGEDGDFIYGSGFFPLPAGETRRFSLALVYGDGGGPTVDIDDLLQNRETVQNIYDSDYRFPPAPDRPTLRAVAGDGKVTLYWDRKAEESFDPVLKVNDFEGYKIYKATDQNFNDVFEVTDADGNPIAYKPLAQFDKDNGINGYFRPGPELFQQARGASFNLGDDTGLKHSFVDTDVENGQRYFYAVVAYDRGDREADIFPKENDKRINILPSGEVETFQNTAMVVPTGQVSGFQPLPNSVQLDTDDLIGTGELYYTVLDEMKIKDHTYQVTFWDTSMDSLDNDEDGLIDGADLNEYFERQTTRYSVRDLSGVQEMFVGQDTINVRLGHQNIIPETVELLDADGNLVPDDLYVIQPAEGRIRGAEPGDLKFGMQYSISYEYYPVSASPYINNSPFQEETRDSDIFDGLSLDFANDWVIQSADTLRWSDADKAIDVNFYKFESEIPGLGLITGKSKPSNYIMEWADTIIDTSISGFGLQPIPVNFRIKNTTEDRYIDFGYNDTDFNQQISPFDELLFFEPDINDSLVLTWSLSFGGEETYEYGEGDQLRIPVLKPFLASDSLTFSPQQVEVDQTVAANSLEDIKVVPNPYIVATSQERPLPPAITVGRGERKMDFIHVPNDAEIHIFTSRGEHVITLHHNSDIFDGSISWNLKSKENLGVAPGVYFYVVDSPVGQKKGKLAIIK